MAFFQGALKRISEQYNLSMLESRLIESVIYSVPKEKKAIIWRGYVQVQLLEKKEKTEAHQ